MKFDFYGMIMLVTGAILVFLILKDSGFKIPGITFKEKEKNSNQVLPEPSLEAEYDFLKSDYFDAFSQLKVAEERHKEARTKYEDILVYREHQAKQELDFIRDLIKNSVEEEGKVEDGQIPV